MKIKKVKKLVFEDLNKKAEAIDETKIDKKALQKSLKAKQKIIKGNKTVSK